MGKQTVIHTLCVASLLTGCAGVGLYAPPGPSIAPQPGVPGAPRAFSVNAVGEGQSYSAYGYLLFTRALDANQPNAETLARHTAICEAFVNQLRPIEEFRRPKNELRQLRPTFWMLKPRIKADRSCKALVLNYDFRRAQDIALAIEVMKEKGPVLVAFVRRYPEGLSGPRLTFRLSDVDAADLPDSLALWMDRILQDPETWKGSFRLMETDYRVKEFINKYGRTLWEASLKLIPGASDTEKSSTTGK